MPAIDGTSGFLGGRLGRAVGDELLEPLLVEDRDTELLGLVGLGSGVLPHHDVVGLLGHRSRRLAAAGDDRLLDRVAGEALERSGDDDREALEGARDRRVALVPHAYAGLAPLADD